MIHVVFPDSFRGYLNEACTCRRDHITRTLASSDFSQRLSTIHHYHRSTPPTLVCGGVFSATHVLGALLLRMRPESDVLVQSRQLSIAGQAYEWHDIPFTVAHLHMKWNHGHAFNINIIDALHTEAMLASSSDYED